MPIRNPNSNSGSGFLAYGGGKMPTSVTTGNRSIAYVPETGAFILTSAQEGNIVAYHTCTNPKLNNWVEMPGNPVTTGALLYLGFHYGHYYFNNRIFYTNNIYRVAPDFSSWTLLTSPPNLTVGPFISFPNTVLGDLLLYATSPGGRKNSFYWSSDQGDSWNLYGYASMPGLTYVAQSRLIGPIVNSAGAAIGFLGTFAKGAAFFAAPFIDPAIWFPVTPIVQSAFPLQSAVILSLPDGRVCVGDTFGFLAFSSDFGQSFTTYSPAFYAGSLNEAAVQAIFTKPGDRYIYIVTSGNVFRTLDGVDFELVPGLTTYQVNRNISGSFANNNYGPESYLQLARVPSNSGFWEVY